MNKSTYLRALALFTLAHNYRLKMSEAEKEMYRVLGLNWDDREAEWIMDQLSEDHPDFDHALRQAGIELPLSMEMESPSNPNL